MNQNDAASAGGGTSVDPGMRVAAWYRAIITALLMIGALVAVIQGSIYVSHGCMDRMVGDFLVWFVALPLVVVGLISGIIAVGLFSNSRKGLWGAVVFDAVVVVLAAVGLLLWNGEYAVKGDFGFLPPRLCAGALVSGVVLLFAVELAWLLNKCRGRKTAYIELGALAIFLFTVTIAWPMVSSSSASRHVNVLRQYVNAHWFSIPRNAQCYCMRGSEDSAGHTDHVGFEVGKARVHLFVKHEPGKGWNFSAGDKNDISALMPADKRPVQQISTEAEARDYLRLCGVPAGNIGADWSLKTNSPNDLIYVFDSPAAGGTYEVTRFGNIKLCLQGPLLVPDSVNANDQYKSAGKTEAVTGEAGCKLDVNGEKIRNPKEKDIVEALSAVDGKRDFTYLILGVSDMTYIQAGRDKPGAFDLEYQAGDLKHHYIAKKKYTPGELKPILLSYLKGDGKWKEMAEWTLMPVK
jgi:hypothetical protein